MVNNLFSISGGLSFDIGCRKYGFQDKGISPEGAQDQLSFDVAYNIFDKPVDFQAIEMLYPAKITANKDILFVVCGASYENIYIKYSARVKKDCVYKLTQGKTLSFSGNKSGFRTIIFAIESSSQNNDFIGKTRPPEVAKIVADLYADKHIRVTKGPEYNVLRDEKLFNQNFTISQNSSQMGLVLEGDKIDRYELEMISQPVTDGTVQLSPNVQIVLMRHRQTVGGYPRIVNVIESDINKLTQFAIGEFFSFKLVN